MSKSLERYMELLEIEQDMSTKKLEKSDVYQTVVRKMEELLEEMDTEDYIQLTLNVMKKKYAD